MEIGQQISKSVLLGLLDQFEMLDRELDSDVSEAVLELRALIAERIRRIRHLNETCTQDGAGAVLLPDATRSLKRDLRSVQRKWLRHRLLSERAKRNRERTADSQTALIA